MLQEFELEIGDPDPWDQSHAAELARESQGSLKVYTASGRWDEKKVRTKGNVAAELLSDSDIDLAEIIKRKMSHWCERSLA